MEKKIISQKTQNKTNWRRRSSLKKDKIGTERIKKNIITGKEGHQ